MENSPSARRARRDARAAPALPGVLAVATVVIAIEAVLQLIADPATPVTAVAGSVAVAVVTGVAAWWLPRPDPALTGWVFCGVVVIVQAWLAVEAVLDPQHVALVATFPPALLFGVLILSWSRFAATAAAIVAVTAPAYVVLADRPVEWLLILLLMLAAGASMMWARLGYVDARARRSVSLSGLPLPERPRRRRTWWS